MAGAEKHELYRKVSVRMFGDEKYRRLTPPQPCGQALWWFLLAGPFTTRVPGIVLGGRLAMCERLGWDPKGFDEAFREVFREGLAEASWEDAFVWLPNGLKHNEPQSPNVVTGWRTVWPLIPECALRTRSFAHIRQYLKGLPKGFAEAFAKAFPEDFGEVWGDTSRIQGAGSREQGAGAVNSESPARARAIPGAGATVHEQDPDDESDPRVAGLQPVAQAYERLFGRLLCGAEIAEVRVWLQAKIPPAHLVAVLDFLYALPDRPRALWPVARALVRDTPVGQAPRWDPDLRTRPPVVDPMLDRILVNRDAARAGERGESAQAANQLIGAPPEKG